MKIKSLKTLSKDITSKYLFTELDRMRIVSECFTPQERRAIFYFYGLVDGKVHTYSETGKYVGASKQRAHMLVQAAFKKMLTVCKLHNW